jgi:NADH-quinone oxidoreductase subunit N
MSSILNKLLIFFPQFLIEILFFIFMVIIISMNNILVIFAPFLIEIILCLLIFILIFIYILNVYMNKFGVKLHNDNFPIEFFTFFLFLFTIILIYLCIKDINIFMYSDKLFVMEKNNLLIKIFILFLFCILCLLWPTTKLLSNIKITLKLLVLLLFAVLGLCIAVDARDLMLLYIGIELASIPIYILVSNKEFMISIEAGIKYYILGTISSFFFLLGISLIYGLTGTTLYSILYIIELYSNNVNNYYMFFIFVFLIVVFLFKIGLYPFNFWVTNFNEGAALNVVFFLSVIPKLPYIYILILLFFNIFNISCIPQFYIIIFLIISAFITIFTSIIEGLSDNHIGRIIGQSSMINMSFIFIVLLCLSIIQEAFFFYLFMFYIIPTLLLFNLLSFRNIMLSKRDFIVLYDLFLVNNYITILLYFTLISLSGLPFLSGFIAK